MPVNKEIERKWLIRKEDIPFDLEGYPHSSIKQSYISFMPAIRLRCIDDQSYVLCVKSKQAKGSLARDEYETEISREQYESLLAKIDGCIIEKTRYFVPTENGLTMEIDVFEGALEGLCYMEIEFPSEEAASTYVTPSWAIKDVSHDHRYKNTALAQLGMPD